MSTFTNGYHNAIKSRNFLPDRAKYFAADARFVRVDTAHNAFACANDDGSVAVFEALDFVFALIYTATRSRNSLNFVYHAPALFVVFKHYVDDLFIVFLYYVVALDIALLG